MKHILFVFGLFFIVCSSSAQLSPKTLDSLFQDWDVRLGKLNTYDPELISLHYLFSQDILTEMQAFKQNTIPKLARCKQIDYYETTTRYYQIFYRARQLNQVLEIQKNQVDYIFYLRAIEELAYSDTALALYNVERSLQYNRYRPDALLLKADLLLGLDRYKECVELVHLIYTKTVLSESQEMAVSDFTLHLYDHLYNLGDSLVKIDRAADALEVFLALEQFCSNMPSGYCNDDYYKGIVRSRKGVYDSYIVIAKEAERRHNPEMARKFYQYADEYRKKTIREDEQR